MNKPLNENQQKALALIGPEWARCPLGIRSATLLCLQERGLIEGRATRDAIRLSQIGHPYTSVWYEWRRKP